MEEHLHLHSEGVICPPQGKGAEYIINVIYDTFFGAISSIHVFWMNSQPQNSKKSWAILGWENQDDRHPTFTNFIEISIIQPDVEVAVDGVGVVAAEWKGGPNRSSKFFFSEFWRGSSKIIVCLCLMTSKFNFSTKEYLWFYWTIK